MLSKLFGKQNKVKQDVPVQEIDFRQALKNVYSDHWNYKDLTQFELDIIQQVKAFTMTSPERMVALIQATEFVIRNRIEGDIVECGVWKGGSMMIVAKVLLAHKITHKKLYLYDTFEGMVAPESRDVSSFGEDANEIFDKMKSNDTEGSSWCFSPLDEVMKNLYDTGYPKENIFFIKGKVEDTIPATIPNSISMLRLDTDWYSSTIHEMNHLYPLITNKGFMIVDDYGHWKGSKQAVDEYLEAHGINLFLNRVDYTCRVAQVYK